MNRNRGTSALALAAVALLALTACGGGGPAKGDTTPTATPSAASTSSSASSTFHSTTFVWPFVLEVPSWLPPQPSKEDPNFVTWDSADGSRHLRLMVPVGVFRPGEASMSAVPADFTAYLLNQSANGVQFADKADATVGGHHATVVTATTSQSLDGSFGCPAAGMAAADCFGFQPDIQLRMAFVDNGERPLLIWLRQDAGAKGLPDQAATLTALLAGLRLVGPSPASTPSP